MKNSNNVSEIGDKSLIEINYRIEKFSPNILGCFYLYLAGEIVGDFENNDTYLIAVYKQLKSILIRKIEFGELNSLDDRGKIKVILSNNSRYDSTILSLSEYFDDYLIRVVRMENDFQFFYFKFQDFEELNFEDVKTIRVPVNYYIDIVKKFGDKLYKGS